MKENVKSSYPLSKFEKEMGVGGILATPTKHMLCISKILNIPLESMDFRDVSNAF